MSPLLLALVLATAGSSEPAVAVLAVDATRTGGEATDPQSAAAAVREKLKAQGAVVLSADETTGRLRSLGVGKGYELASLRQRLQAAEDAFAALDTGRSIEILEGVLRDLANDADFSTDKQALLEKSRIRAAARLMGLAGPDEKGAGNTPLGKRALSHLVDALRANPSLALSPKEHPPKLRRLLDLARAELSKEGLGGLSVDSTPEGATVYIEGRPVGLTPLRLLESTPRGRYRMWVALDEARSATRWIEVGADTARVEVDLAFEGSLWPEGPGLRPVRGQTIDEAVAARVGALAGVEVIVLVGYANYDGARWLYGAVFSTSKQQTMRRGAVRVSGESASDAAIDTLTAFLWKGEADALNASAVPASVLPSYGTTRTQAAAAAEGSEPLPEAASDEGDLMPWVLGGSVAAGVGLAALTAGGIALWVVANPPAPTGRFDLEVVP